MTTSRCFKPSPRPMSLLLVTAFLAMACSPSLNWRDVSPPGSGLKLLFPCKPKAETRPVSLKGVPVTMSLYVCQADGKTFGLAVADTGEAAQAEAALTALSEAQSGNLAGAVVSRSGWVLAGASGNPPAWRQQISGRLPDGGAVIQEAGFFAKGTRVFQVTVMGTRADLQAAEAFFEGLKLSD
jgi:hypothetical protein